MGAGNDTEAVVLGRITGVFGVQGWVKVLSYTRPREGILQYRTWRVGRPDHWQDYALRAGRLHGKGLVAVLEGCEDRDRAGELVGKEIAVRASDLPPLEGGQHYWRELEGLTVVNQAGRRLGVVSHLMETGANDVLVVKGERERLIPYIDTVVRRVDKAAGVIEVDWEADF